MSATDGDSVLELGARFHAPQQERAASVRVDGFVQQPGIQRLGERGGEA